MKGTVKFWNSSKGYGFLECPGLTDIFVHYTAIAGDGYKELTEGDHVEFELIKGPKGPQADQVRKLP